MELAVMGNFLENKGIELDLYGQQQYNGCQSLCT